MDHDSLQARAKKAQLSARARTACPLDNFLVTPVSSVSPDKPTGVCPFSSEIEEKVRRELYKQGRSFDAKGPDERTISKILTAQSPHKVTEFAGSASTLPGGVPLVDHLMVQMTSSPDWSLYVPAVSDLRHHRLPSTSDTPSVWEITLGVTSTDTVDRTIEYIKARTKETARKFGFCSLAADTESIGIQKGLIATLSSKPPGESHELKIANSGQPADNLPVLLMVGHIGWQVHIRLPTEKLEETQDGDLLIITPGELQPNISTLVKEFRNLTGVEVTKDLEKFFSVTKTLYGKDLLRRIPPATELEVLARFAGYNCPRYSMATLNWIVMGTIMPKGRCSAGDAKWHQPWEVLPKPLQAYLIGDVAQAAAISWVFTMCWIIQLFPDMHLVRQVSTFNQPALLQWWQFEILTQLPTSTPGQWLAKDSRNHMVQFLTASSKHSELLKSLHPDWPSVPAGGARFDHTVRTFLLDRLPSLRAIGQDFWLALLPQQFINVQFGRYKTPATPSPTHPVQRLGLVSNPDIQGRLKGPLSEITPAKIREFTGCGVGTRALVTEYARMYPSEGQKMLEVLERSRHASKKFFHFSLKGKEVVPDLRLMMTAFHMMPKRPPDWTDPYPPKERVEQLQKETTQATVMAAKLSHKAAQLTRRSNDLITNITIAKRKATEIVDQTCAKPNLQPPSNKRRKLTAEIINKIGSAEPSSKKTSRDSIPATITSGALNNNTGETQSGVCTPPPPEPAPMICVAGNSHALRLAQAFRQILPSHSHVRAISMISLRSAAVTAKTLAAMDLKNTALILWPFDLDIYRSQDKPTGLRLDRSGITPHVQGKLQVAYPEAIPAIGELSIPLLSQTDRARASAILTPMPLYITGPCCANPDHSINAGSESHATYVINWSDHKWTDLCHWILGSGYNTRVLAPFDMLTDGQPITPQVWHPLYSQDNMHLTSTSYRDLAAKLLTLLDIATSSPVEPIPAEIVFSNSASNSAVLESSPTHSSDNLFTSHSPQISEDFFGPHRTVRECSVASGQSSDPGHQPTVRLLDGDLSGYQQAVPSRRVIRDYPDNQSGYTPAFLMAHTPHDDEAVPYIETRQVRLLTTEDEQAALRGNWQPTTSDFDVAENSAMWDRIRADIAQSPHPQRVLPHNLPPG